MTEYFKDSAAANPPLNLSFFCHFFFIDVVKNIEWEIMSTDTTDIASEHTTCTNELKNMHTKCTEEEVDACASCGKEGSNLNTCNKCKDAKYCNAACKKKHRSKHKKKCERCVAELHDIELFKQPPTREDCPICMVPLSLLHTGRKYYSCCGKIICSGCIHAISLRDKEEKCPFCRAPSKHYSDQEIIKRLQKRMEAEDATAMFNLGAIMMKVIWFASKL